MGGKSLAGASLPVTRNRLAWLPTEALHPPNMSVPAAASASAYSKDRPFPAKLSENRLLSKPGSAKETRHFVVDLRGSGLHYKAGDSLGIFPSNRESEVTELLQRL